MTFTLGIFDLYTYTVPGAAMVGFLAYLGVRLELVDPRAVTSLPGLALLLIAAGLSFVLGHLLYALGSMLDQVGPLSRWDHGDARRTFLARVPAAAGRPFVTAHGFLLLAAAELHDRESTVVINQVRAQGLMLRNLLIPTGLGLVASIVELAVGPYRPLAAAGVVGLTLAIVLMARQSRIMRRWAELRTLELCYWIPGIDEQLSPSRPAGTDPATRGSTRHDAL